MSDTRAKNEAIIAAHYKKHEEANIQSAYTPKVAADVNLIREKQELEQTAIDKSSTGISITNSVLLSRTKPVISTYADSNVKVGKKTVLTILFAGVAAIGGLVGLFRTVFTQETTKAAEPIVYKAIIVKIPELSEAHIPYQSKPYTPTALKIKSIELSDGIIDMINLHVKTNAKYTLSPIDLRRDLKELAKKSSTDYIVVNDEKISLDYTDSSIDTIVTAIGFRCNTIASHLAEDIDALNAADNEPPIVTNSPQAVETATNTFRAAEAKREQARTVANKSGRQFN